MCVTGNVCHMASCDNCDSDVLHVWKHRRPTDTMTHRTTEWRCTDCHPKMAGVFADGCC